MSWTNKQRRFPLLVVLERNTSCRRLYVGQVTTQEGVPDARGSSAASTCSMYVARRNKTTESRWSSVLAMEVCRPRRGGS